MQQYPATTWLQVRERKDAGTCCVMMRSPAVPRSFEPSGIDRRRRHLLTANVRFASGFYYRFAGL